MLSWRGRSPSREGVTAFIDEGSEIEGRYVFTGTVMLNGRFTGEISGGETLIVGEKAQVRADVRAGCVVVTGEVVGNIVGDERVELRRPARVFGDVEAPTFLVEEGVLFEGRCRMTKSAPGAETPRGRDGAVVPLKRQGS
jgi:cytoskeletal protein CcmA (bactofilin family)